MNKEEKARELYPVKNQHVPTIGGRTAYIDVNEKARNAFLKGVECANQQPEVEWVCSQFTPVPNETSVTKCNRCGKEKWEHLKQPEQGEVDE